MAGAVPAPASAEQKPNRVAERTKARGEPDRDKDEPRGAAKNPKKRRKVNHGTPHLPDPLPP